MLRSRFAAPAARLTKSVLPPDAACERKARACRGPVGDSLVAFGSKRVYSPPFEMESAEDHPMTPMERYARFIVRHRVAAVIAVAAVTALLASQLGNLHLENRRRANFPTHHPYVEVHNRISDLFGGEAVVMLGVVANEGTIFTPAILGKIHRITQGLLDTTGIIDPSLISLSAPYVKAVVAGPDGMDVRPLMEDPPETDEEVARVRAMVEEDHLFRGNIVAADGSAAIIVADFDDRINDVGIAQRVEEIVAPERDDSVTIALAGAPILNITLQRYSGMIAILFPIAVLVIGLVHYEAFRTVQAMVLPLVTALLSVVWALGIMGTLRLPMDSWSSITPVIILAIAAGHAVQILKRFYEEYAVVQDHHEAVVRSLTAVGPVMLTAGFIAAGGFASLMTFDISSVRAFGMLLAAGILSALAIEMTFTPACRSLMPPPRRREVDLERKRYWLDPILEALSRLVLGRVNAVIWVWAVILVAAAAGIVFLTVDNSFRLWFSPSTQVRRDDALLNAKLPGTANFRILLEGDHAKAVLQPEVLRAVSDLEDFLEADDLIAGVTSIADHVKRMHQAMHEGREEFYAIPEEPRLIEQYLFLYSMSAGPDGLSSFLDADGQHGVIRGLSKTDGAVFSRQLLEGARAFADERFAGLPVKVGIAGGTLGVQTAMNDTVVREKMLNVVQVSTIIFVLSALVLRSLVGGLLVLTPLLASVLITLGLMGWVGTWLDMTTAAFTAMAMSIGADFAIYMIFRVREENRTAASLPDAVGAALLTSGKAIFFVSSAVALGYLVLPFAGFSLWNRLGILTSTMILLAALGSLTLLPALVLRFRPRLFGAPRRVPELRAA